MLNTVLGPQYIERKEMTPTQTTQFSGKQALLLIVEPST